MNSEKLMYLIGDIDDRYILEASNQPEECSTGQHKTLSNKLLRYLIIAALLAIFMLGTTVFASNYIQNNISSFYLRYLSPEEMAIADSMADEFGAKVYFDALESNDIYKQYFAINKLVEYYNDEEIRQEAIRSIEPFLDNEEEKISDAASFAISILSKTFDDPRIVFMADGTLIFALFNNYSEYGSYSQLWMIKDDKLIDLECFDRPQMYITQIIPSPDKRLFAVSFCSNKSEYIEIHDLENGVISPELIGSARIMLAKELDHSLWLRIDSENYCSTSLIKWATNSRIIVHANLTFDDGEINNDIVIQYEFYDMNLEISD